MLYFSKSERRGAYFLLALCVITFATPYFFRPKPQLDILKKAAPVFAVQAKKSEFHFKKRKFSSYTQNKYSPAPKAERFNFDPNTVDENQLQALGLSPKVAAIWIKFRSKGGRFRQKEDVLKVFGVKEWWYGEVANYIQITPLAEADFKPKNEGFSAQPNAKARPCRPLDVNQADTSAWQALSGIGGVLASRIIKFRSKLGGFQRIEQVGETFGLADSVFQKIKPCLQLGAPVAASLKINEADLKILSGHPYVGFKLAKTIIAYRTEHGPFKQLDDLLKIGVMDQAQVDKLRGYVVF
jgi:competence protein ComEA